MHQQYSEVPKELTQAEKRKIYTRKIGLIMNHLADLSEIGMHPVAVLYTLAEWMAPDTEGPPN